MPRGAPHKVPHVRACATLCGLGASSWAHSRRTIAVFAVRKSVRVGAAPKGPQKAQNLQFERPARRCRKPTTPLGADLRRAMRPRAPQRVVCRVVCRWARPRMRRCTLHVACPPWCKHATPHAPTVPRRHVRACATLCGLGASSWAHTPHTVALLRFGCRPCV